MFGGFYTIKFQLNDAVGRSVMYVYDGKLLGGNSAFAHIGTYEELGGGEVAVEVRTVRHNFDPNYVAMAGRDDATLIARGRADGNIYRFEGALKELPGAVFKSVMTPVAEQTIPIAGAVGEGGIVNGLYSIHLHMLDGVEGGLTGVMLLHDGRVLGGDAFFYYLGILLSRYLHFGKRPLEGTDSQPGAHAGKGRPAVRRPRSRHRVFRHLRRGGRAIGGDRARRKAQPAHEGRAQADAAGLEHDPEKWKPVFPRDKRGTRLRGDHAQTKS